MDSVGYIDIHSHILPGIDDGPESMEETVLMLRQAKQQGISTIIATPHYICGAKNIPAERLEEVKEKVQEEAVRIDPEFKILLGNELYYCESILEELSQNKALTLAGSRYVLVEFSIDESYKAVYQGLKKLVLAGYAPIVAHVERYLCIKQNEELIRELIKLGAYIQLNSRSLQGGFFNKEAVYYRKLLKNGFIHLIATDSHDNMGRAPKMKDIMKGLRKTADDKLLEQIFLCNPVKITEDKYI